MYLKDYLLDCYLYKSYYYYGYYYYCLSNYLLFQVLEDGAKECLNYLQLLPFLNRICLEEDGWKTLRLGYYQRLLYYSYPSCLGKNQNCWMYLATTEDYIVGEYEDYFDLKKKVRNVLLDMGNIWHWNLKITIFITRY